MADEIQIKIGTEIDDTDIKGLEDKLADLQAQQLELQLRADMAELEEVQTRINEINDRLLEPGLDNTEILELENELAELEQKEIQLQVRVAKDELEQAKQDVEELEEETSTLDDLISAGIGVGSFAALSNEIWQCIDSAGQFEDVVMRANLEAEGAGISTEQMSTAINELGNATGRSATQLREGFIKANARGISDLNSFKDLMKGAGAQATLFGTDIESMADKFTMMAQRDTLMQRQLANTGITFQELAKVMGVSVDEVKDKWKTLDTDTRASLLGQAASLNEGKNANEAYKNSWAGLQDQLTRGLEKIKRLFGEIFLPIVKPAISAVITVLSSLGDVISGIMSGPLSGFVSILTVVGTGLVLAVPAIMAFKSAINFLTVSLNEQATAAWAALTPLLPYIAVGAAIAGVIYGIGVAFGWWHDLGSMFDAIGAGLNSIWESFINNQYVVEIIDLIKQGLTDAWNAIVGFGEAIWTALGGGAGEFDILSMAIQTLQTVLSVVGPFVILVLQGFMQHFRNLYNLGVTVWSGISQVISTAIGIIVGVVNTGKAVFSGLIGIWNSAKSTVQGLASTVSSAMSTASGAWNGFKNSVANAVNYINDKINELKDKVNGAGDWVKGQIGMGGIEASVVTGFNSAGTGAVGGTVFNITINGNIDSEARVNQLKEDFAAIVNGEITENETVIG